MYVSGIYMFVRQDMAVRFWFAHCLEFFLKY